MLIRGINEILLTVGEIDEWAPIAGQLGATPHAPSESVLAWRSRNVSVAISKANPSVAEPCGQVHQAGITHICVQSRDAWALYDSLAAEKVRFNAPLTTLGNGTHYAYGALPSGATIEIESAVYAPDGYEGTWISHVALATPDLARLSGFYTALTGRSFVGGWQVKPSPANDLITGYTGADMKVGWVACGNLMLEFWQYLHPVTEARPAPKEPGSPGYAAITFEVEGLATGLDVLAAAGVTDLGAMTVDAAGIARVTGRDPDGNRIDFVDFTQAYDRSGALDALADADFMPRLAEYRATLPLPHFRPEMQW